MSKLLCRPPCACMRSRIVKDRQTVCPRLLKYSGPTYFSLKRWRRHLCNLCFQPGVNNLVSLLVVERVHHVRERVWVHLFSVLGAVVRNFEGACQGGERLSVGITGEDKEVRRH